MAETSGYKVQFSVAGDRKLRKLLKRVGHKDARKIVRASMAKETRVLRKAMKAIAPRDTGQLRRSLVAKVKTYSTGTVFGVIGVARNAKNKETGRNPQNYLHLVVRGTQAHGDHPGVEANDFVGKTLETKGRQSAERMQAEMLRRLLVAVKT